MRPDPLVVPLAPGTRPAYDVYGRLAINGSLLKDLLGVDPLVAATWTAAVDAITASGTLTLALGQGSQSTSPHMSSSLLALADCQPRAGQKFALETATVPKGATPTGSDWRRVFDGEIDASDVAGEATVLSCRDMLCVAADTQIEPGTEYGFAAGGTDMLTTLADIQAAVAIYAPDAGIGGSLPLYHLSDPEWSVVAYWQQAGMSLAEAWQRVVLQRGWAIGWRYPAGLTTGAVQTYDPVRADQDSAFPFSHGDVIRFSRFSTDRTEVRNFIALQWGADRAIASTAGDGESIGLYGRRYMLFTEDATSEIDTEDEANRMLAAAHRDQSNPTHLVDYERFYCWPVELGDNQTLAPDGVRHDTALALNVVGYTHALDFRPRGQFRSTIRTLGHSVAVRRKWRQVTPRMVHAATTAPAGVAPERALWAQYTP